MPKDRYWVGLYNWFDRCYSEKITDEFAEFWLDLYGHPSEYEDKTEYCIRMSFAFVGWEARTNYEGKVDTESE